MGVRKEHKHPRQHATPRVKLLITYTNADVLTVEKLRELKDIARLKKPDIIIVNEVKPKNFTRDLEKCEYSIPGYVLETTDNLKPKDRGRGIFIYIHESIVYTPVILKNIFSDNSPYPVEMLACELKLKKDEKFLISGVYRNGKTTPEGNAALFKAKDILSNMNFKHIFYSGDYNLPDICWNEDKSYPEKSLEYKFLNCINNNYLTQHVDTPTRGRGTNKPSLLDLVLTNQDDAIENITTDAPLGPSDHSVIHIEYRCEPVAKPDRLCVMYKKADFVKMNNMIFRTPEEWQELFKECPDDVNKQWDIFSNIFSTAEKECVPRKLIKSGKRSFSIPLDRKNLALKKKKYKLWQRFLNTRDGELYTEYRRCSNKLRSLTRKATMICEKDMAANSKGNPKLIHQYLNSKTKIKSSIPDLYLDDDMDEENMARDDLTKANIFANFFSSVQTKEPDGTWTLPNKPNPSVDIILDINREALLKKLEKIKTNKAPGPDGMHPLVLNKVRDSIVDPLLIIFQTSVRTKCVPDAWKIAHISAIYKKDNKHVAGNYRPVSLTSIVCKLLESFIRDALVDYMKSNNFFTNKQFGFLKGRSTVLQLLKVIDRWTEILDSGGWVDAIYCDFRKAFDTVPHRRLLTVLEHYGVTDPVLSWVKSFLSDRKQKVIIGGKDSEWHAVISGIPQGSVLGPVLFVIFINTMADRPTDIEQFLFADDAKASVAVYNFEDTNVLQNGINDMVEWSDISLLQFHPGKCKAMRLFSSNLPDFPCLYIMKGKLLAESTEEKDLGVIIDSKLTFESHIYSKIKKANRMAGLIRRSFTFLDKHMFRQLFTSMVRPHLEYAAPVWNPYKQRFIDDIENVQRRASKKIPGLNNLSYPDRLKALNLPTLQYRRYRGDMIEMWKLTHDKYDSDAIGNLVVLQVSRSRGHQYNLAKPSSHKNLNCRLFSFIHRIREQWNNLPAEIVSANTINTFKNKLDKLWEGSDVYFNHEAKVHDLTSARGVRYMKV